MKELSWFLQMAPLLVLMKANPRVPCLGIDLEKKLVPHLVLLMVLWTKIKMACWTEQQLGPHLVHMMDVCLALIKALYSALLMGKCFAQHLGLCQDSHLVHMMVQSYDCQKAQLKEL